MKNRFLLYIEEPETLKNVQNVLQEEGYQVAVAKDEDELCQQAATEDVAGIISEAKIMTCPGNPLLRYLYKTVPHQKIVLLTELSYLSESQEALKMGCEMFIPKPITKQDLLRSISALFKPVETFEFDETKYARVGIEDFIYGRSIPYRIYVRLKNRRFCKIADKGENIDLELIDQCKARGLGELWLEKKDFDRYVKEAQHYVHTAVNDEDLENKKKTRLIAHACEVATENLRIMGITEANLVSAKDTLVNALSVLSSNSSALGVLEAMDGQPDTSYTKAATSGILCGLLADVMGWLSEKNRLTLALGGYLHDVGLNYLPLELQTLSETEMTEEQFSDYSRHPRIGAEELTKFSGVPDEVITIVQQHHENRAGTGFPDRLPSDKISPMASIVSLVDNYCSVYLRKHSKENPSPTSLLQNLVEEYPHWFDQNSILALEMLLTYSDKNEAAKKYEAATKEKKQS